MRASPRWREAAGVVPSPRVWGVSAWRAHACVLATPCGVVCARCVERSRRGPARLDECGGWEGLWRMGLVMRPACPGPGRGCSKCHFFTYTADPPPPPRLRGLGWCSLGLPPAGPAGRGQLEWGCGPPSVRKAFSSDPRGACLLMGYRYPLAAVPPVLSALGGVPHPCAPSAPSAAGGGA